MRNTMQKDYSNITTISILDLNVDVRKITYSSTFSRKLDMPKILNFLKWLVVIPKILNVKEFEAFVKSENFDEIESYLSTSTQVPHYVPIGENKFLVISLSYSYKYVSHTFHKWALNDEENNFLDMMNNLIVDKCGRDISNQ